MLPLRHWIGEGQGLNILNAKVHVTSNSFQQIWLILNREILVCIATEDGERVQCPVDLAGLARLEGQSHPLGLRLCLRELYLQSVIVLGFVVETCRR